jgi:hypothetical protein
MGQHVLSSVLEYSMPQKQCNKFLKEKSKVFEGKSEFFAL